jgi:hypothetical protein
MVGFHLQRKIAAAGEADRSVEHTTGRRTGEQECHGGNRSGPKLKAIGLFSHPSAIDPTG